MNYTESLASGSEIICPQGHAGSFPIQNDSRASNLLVECSCSPVIQESVRKQHESDTCLFNSRLDWSEHPHLEVLVRE